MATKLTTKFRKIISLFLALNLILLLLPDTWFTGIGTTMKAQAANEINGHSLIAENDNLALYMNEEDLSVVVEDKATGAYMESSISYDDGKNNNTWMGAMSSALVLTLINQNDDTKQADLLNDDVTKNIQYTDNGFTAEVYWTTYKIGMTLEVSLLEDGLMARVADESIKEDGDRYYIGTIAI